MKVSTEQERVVIAHAGYWREFLGTGPHEVTAEEFEQHLADTGLFKEIENADV